MKRIFTVVLILHTLFVFAGYRSLSIEEAQKKWGRITFKADEFKKGNFEIRAKMVVDLIDSKVFIGKEIKIVRKLLGPQDGYFINDSILAYLLTPIKSKKMWQVVFIPDKKWQKVKKVEIKEN